MSDTVLVALITAGFPVLATAITAYLQHKATNRNAAKQSILQMILEDHVAVSEGHLPTNYQNILHEFDIYHANHGNSYLEKKVREYESWFGEIERGKK